MTTPTVVPSFMFQRGAEARRADLADLAKWKKLGPLTSKPMPQPTPNPLIGNSGKEWQEGYDSVSPETDQENSNGRNGATVHPVVLDQRPAARTIGGSALREPFDNASSEADRAPHDVASKVSPDARPVSNPPRDFRVFGIVLIVDYSSLLHRAFHAGEPSNIHGVRSMFETLANAIERLSPEYIIFAFDGGHTERTSLSPEYKAHRPERPPELQRQLELGERAIAAIGWPSIRVVGWEADDVCASLVKLARPLLLTDAEILVATSDKDALQLIPLGASIYHPWDKGQVIAAKAVGEKYGVAPEKIGDFLSLTGDGTDGVAGVDGIGPKTAAELLNKYGSLAGIFANSTNIKGKIGDRLQNSEQQRKTLIDRQLVQLCFDIPVGFHWSEFPLAKPSAGWHERLAELKLPMVAHRLASTFSQLAAKQVERTACSHVEFQWSRPVTVLEPGRIGEACAVENDDGGLPAKTVSPETSTRATPAPERGTSNAIPPDSAPLLDRLRAHYDVALAHRAAGRTVENDFRRWTAHHEVYAQGLAGQPFSIDLTLYKEDGDSLTIGDAILTAVQNAAEPVGLDARWGTESVEVGLFGPVETPPPEIGPEPTLAELGVESIEPPTPLEPLPDSVPLPIFMHWQEHASPDLASRSGSSELTRLDLPSPDSESPAETYQMQPPQVLAISDLLLGCHNTDETDREYWQTITLRIALELKPDDWNFPVTDAREAIITLQVLQDRALSRESFVASINSVLKRLFQGDDMPALAKKPAAKQQAGLSPSEQLEAIRLLCGATPDRAKFWRDQKGIAWSDDTLEVKLSSFWLTAVKIDQPPAIASSLGGASVWFGQTHSRGEPDLKGPELYSFIREVFEITRPGRPEKDESFLEISPKIEKRAIAAIRRSPFDHRILPADPKTDPKILELAQSLKTHGQWNALLIRPDGEHIAGWRRVLAAGIAGLKELEVRIVKCDDLTAELMVLEENAKREDLTEREQCIAYNELAAKYAARNWSREKLAKNLNIAPSTLENKLRLKWLSPEIWNLYEAKRLDIDQLRNLATHATQSGFLAAFMLPLTKSITFGEERISSELFNRAVAMGLADAYRPMRRNEEGEGAQFKPKPAEREALGIVKIEHPHLGEIEVATNVEKWEELNSAATVKKEQRETKRAAAAPAPVPLKPAKAAKAALNQEARADEMQFTWSRAFAHAIGGKFAKLAKKDTTALHRIGMLVQQCLAEPEQLKLEVLLLDDADKFNEKLRVSVVDFFSCESSVEGHDWRELDFEILKKLAKFVCVDPAPWWRPTAKLFSLCTEQELQTIRDDIPLEAALEDKNRSDFESRLLAQWDSGGECEETGWCPDQFLLKKVGK